MTAQDSLPAPHCPEGLGTHCPGPFETITSQRVPGETDVTVRCRECQACAHYTLPAATAPATGTGEATPSEPSAPAPPFTPPAPYGGGGGGPSITLHGGGGNDTLPGST